MATEAISMPVAVEAERAILGAILTDNKRLYEAAAFLRAEDFALDAHRLLFRRVMELADAGNPVDLVSVSGRLREHGELLRVGGAAYLSDLTTLHAVGIANVGQHAKKIREKAQRRQLVSACQARAAQATDPGETVESSLGAIQDALLNIQAASIDTQAVAAKHITMPVLDEIAAVRGRRDSVIGLSTGIAPLDTFTTGIRPDEYWVIGALPSRGKSLLGVQIAAVNAKAGIPVLIFSAEMTKRQVIRRILTGEGNVPAKLIRDPRRMTEYEFDRLSNTATEVASWPLYVDDAEELSAQQLVARARLAIRRYGVKLIVVDYLQLLNAPGKEMRDRVTEASNALRLIPKTEGVPVVALSQLARPRDRNENSRPIMVELKESGSIEAHAHVVLLLYRPKNSQGQWNGEDEIIIAKQREGLVSWVAVTLQPEHLRFVERTVTVE
jgi:replicative DNA helicase